MVIFVAFIPMLLVAVAAHHLNRATPDCGTTFSWVTDAMGPYAGWLCGWSIIVTDIIVMPSLAIISATYTLKLAGIAPVHHWVAIEILGVAWIAVMTLLCFYGIELSSRVQQGLLGIELSILALFAVVALFKLNWAVRPQDPAPSMRWLEPSVAHGPDDLINALLAAVFIYWGWDTSVAVNEETRRPDAIPGRAAIAATVLLVVTYTLVAVAALGFAGPASLAHHANHDIFEGLGRGVFGAGFIGC